MGFECAYGVKFQYSNFKCQTWQFTRDNKQKAHYRSWDNGPLIKIAFEIRIYLALLYDFFGDLVFISMNVQEINA